MRIVLESPCPPSYYRISNNPYGLDSLVSQMNSVVKNLNIFSKNGRGFVMRVSEYAETESEEEEEEEEEPCQICTSCNDDNDLYPMINILHESAMLRYAIARVEKYRETREHVERRLDCQYRQEVAHALDIYLTSVQQRVHARAETI
ncbi:hypothetical protein Bca52824_054221 [Brassica carinata]|uniref:Uncharacterized protein n=1 Tax=Brassica carinata TaxID=52824 RepID=A0A8X7R702_BRACI|nr:hypothetical protein Bca52824_054221 [Brassica carinata]